MQEAGTVLHLARSGRLIIKAASQVRDGTLLVDEQGRHTGKVMETIGPASSPYLSAQPTTERIERLIGAKLYVDETRRNARDSERVAKSRKNSSQKRARGSERTGFAHGKKRG